MENVNSCCFVARINEINKIEGADKIVQAVISGWECVIQKDKHKIGDLVVIATTDAVIPLQLAEDLGVVGYLKNRKKTGQLTVKTTKLRGVYSSALILCPIGPNSTYKGGEDMMKEYGIEKYEEPAVVMQLSSGRKIRYHKNPNFHVYHKFPNAKNAPNVFTEDDIVVITNKIHGCNARYGIVKKSKLSIIDRIRKFFGKKWVDYDFVYGSHEMEKGSGSQGFYSTDVWRTVAEEYKIEQELWDFVKKYPGSIGEGVILYGEIYGEGIQKYYSYGEKKPKIKFFDIKLNGEYLNHHDFEELIWHRLPRIESLHTGPYDKDIIEQFQNNRFINGSKVPEEGVVVKSITGDRSKIVKYINPAYLEFQSKKEDSTDFH